MRNVYRLLACLVLGVIFSFDNTNARKPKLAAVPLPANVLRTLQPGHPRLLAHPEDFAKLRKRIAEQEALQKWHAELRGKGEALLVAEPVRYELDNGKLLDVSRTVLKRMYTLGMLYQLHQDARYSVRAWKELQVAAAFPDWNPAHFLDAAEMTHAFAIGYDWMYAAWTKEQRAVLEKAILEKGLREALLAYQGKAQYKRTWWTDSKNNWNQVCNGGVGIGALAVAEKDPALAEAVLRHAIAVLPNAMQKFGPDGAWNEGPGYWALATQYNAVFLASLESALGSDFGLGQIEGFSRTGLFPVYMNGPFYKSFNYADATDRPIGGPQLFWFAAKFGLPLAARLQESLVESPHALDLLWYPEAEKPETAAPQPLAAYFRFTEVVSMRSAWNDSNAWFVGFKAGDNTANHSHLDLGSFVLDAHGKRWVADLGNDSYKLPDYFDTGNKKGFNGRRWSYYRTRAEGHNTLVLNPGLKPDQHPGAAAKITNFGTKRNTSFAIADLTPAYASDALHVSRGIALVSGTCVVVQDEVKALRPSKAYWFVHTPAHIAIQEDGRRAILSLDGKQLEAVLVSPAGAAFCVLPAKPLPTSPQPEGIKNNDAFSRLTIALDQLQHERIVVEFREPGKTETAATAFYKPLSKWQIN